MTQQQFTKVVKDAKQISATVEYAPAEGGMIGVPVTIMYAVEDTGRLGVHYPKTGSIVERHFSEVSLPKKVVFSK